MLTGFSFHDEWMSPSRIQALFRVTRWNQYVGNWPIVLNALRHLWEIGKVSEFKTPFYEPVEKPINK